MLLINRSNEITIPQFLNCREKVCVYRAVGGLGDILAMRMIFEDMKEQFPNFHITWAVPYRFFAAALRHPFVDEVIHIDHYKKINFLETFDITTPCGRYESIHKNQNPKNRSDIWANHFGLQLSKHNMHMPSYKELLPQVELRLKKIGWDGRKKLVAFAPRSAMSIKNMTHEQCKIIKNMTKDFFLFILHTAPILEIDDLKIPGLYNLAMNEALAAVELSDYTIATDTGLLHAAAGYNKPALGTFGFVDGYVYCKYYPTVKVLQIHKNQVDNWCGPCWDYPKCPYDKNHLVKPCQSQIGAKMLEENWHSLLNT